MTFWCSVIYFVRKLPLFCPPDLSSKKTAHQHTQRAAPKSGCMPTVQNLLQRISGLQIRRKKTLGLSCVGCNVTVAYHKLQTKPKTIAELKEALQLIWDNLPQGPIDKAVKDFSKRLKACVGVGGGHFEYSK